MTLMRGGREGRPIGKTGVPRMQQTWKRATVVHLSGTYRANKEATNEGDAELTGSFSDPSFSIQGINPGFCWLAMIKAIARYACSASRIRGRDKTDRLSFGSRHTSRCSGARIPPGQLSRARYGACCNVIPAPQ